MQQTGEQHPIPVDPSQLPPGWDGAASAEYAQVPMTYEEVFTRHPDMNPLLAEHVQRLADTSRAKLMPSGVGQSSSESIDEITLTDAEANPSHHDWHRIAAETNISQAHDAQHNALANQFGIGDAQPDMKFELAVEAELGAVAEQRAVEPLSPSTEQSLSVTNGVAEQGEMTHDQAVSLRETAPAPTVTSEQALSAEEKQQKAQEWIADHTVTQGPRSETTDPWAAPGTAPKTELQFAEGEQVPHEFGSEVAVALLENGDYKMQQAFHDNIDRFSQLGNDVAEKIQQGSYPADVIEHADKIPGLELNMALANNMIGSGNGWAVVAHADKFPDVTLDNGLADKLVASGQAGAVLGAPEKFTGVVLDAAFVDKALETPSNVWDVAGNIDKFTGVEPDDNLAQRIVATGQVGALAGNLDKFSGLSNETASAIISVNPSALFSSSDKFPDLTSKDIADMVVSSPNGNLWGVEKLPTEAQSAIVRAKLAKDGSIDLVPFSSLDTATAESLVEKGFGGEMMAALDKFPGFEPDLALATKLIQAADGYPASVVGNINRFPAEIHGDIASMVAEKGFAQSLQAYLNDGSLAVDKDFATRINAVGRGYETGNPIDAYLENFPHVDQVSLAKTFLRVADQGGRPATYQMEQLIKGLPAMHELNDEVAQELVAAGYYRDVVANISSFTDLDASLAERFIASGDAVSVIKNHERFTGYNLTAGTASALLETEPGQGELQVILYYMDPTGPVRFDNVTAEKAIQDGLSEQLANHINLFNGLDSQLANRLIEDGQGYAVLANTGSFTNMDQESANRLAGAGYLREVLQAPDSFSDFSPLEAATAAIQHGHAYSVFNSLGQLPDLKPLADNQDPAVQRFADMLHDTDLVESLQADGQLHMLDRQFIGAYMGSDNPDMVIQTIKGLGNGQAPLWKINYEYARLQLGDPSALSEIQGYKVDALPLSLPAANTSEFSTELPAPTTIASMDEDTRRMVIKAASLQANPDLLHGAEVSFGDLNTDAQEAVMAYRLYNSIAITRDAHEQQRATERNKAFAEAGQYIQEDTLAYAVDSSLIIRKAVQSGFLPGEHDTPTGSERKLGLGIEAVSVNEQIVQRASYRDQLAALQERGRGSAIVLFNNTETAQAIGDSGAEHKLLLGGVPGTEMKAVLLTNDEQSLRSEVIDTVVESGVYVPVIDASGAIALSFEDYQARRADGNYINVQPRIVDHSFKREGTQGGNNEGAKFVLPTAQGLEHHYVKFADESATERDHIWTEVLTDSIYRAVKPELVPDTEAVIVEGRLARTSKLLDIDESVPVSNRARNAGFILDCFVGNWDLTNEANLAMTSDGRAPRFDNGSSLDFEALGYKKENGTFTGVVQEIEDGNLYGGIGRRQHYPGLTKEEIISQTKELQTYLPDSMIEALVNNVRRSNADRQHLIQTLQARRQYLIDKFLSDTPSPSADTQPMAWAGLDDSVMA